VRAFPDLPEILSKAILCDRGDRLLVRWPLLGIEKRTRFLAIVAIVEWRTFFVQTAMTK
jgi:hypothetical protein